MSNTINKTIPTLVQIKTDELGINMLLNLYNQIQADYNKNIAGGFSVEAKNDLKKMSEINARLMTLINTTKTTLDNAYLKGINNQTTVSNNNPYLVEIAKQLKKDENEIKKVYDDLKEADASIINSSKQRVSNLYKYIAMMILSIVTITLTLRAYLIDDTDSIETIILVLAIALFLYHLTDKYITPLNFYTILR